jgi:plasmid stability protein
MTIKNLPKPLHQELRKRAQANGRSLNREVILTLQQLISPQTISPSERIAELERLEKHIKFSVTLKEIQKAIENCWAKLQRTSSNPVQ